jgi:hypothetical protein
MTSVRVPAVGGRRTVPAPDPIAERYLLIGLRLDQHRPGLLDTYYGPADLKARVDLEPLPDPTRLAADAARLRDDVVREVREAPRARWLERQLVALEMRARLAAGQPVPYRDQVRAAIDDEPAPVPAELWVEMRRELDRLVPGRGELTERLEAWDTRWIVPADRLRAVVDAAIPWVRERIGDLLVTPTGESVEAHIVHDVPWAGAAVFEGGGRTRIDISSDMPRRLPELVDTLAHETYTGHHLDSAMRELSRVEEQGWLEASLMINETPEEYLAEGMAIYGTQLLLPPAVLAAGYGALAEVAGLTAVLGEAELAAHVHALREQGMAAWAETALRLNEVGQAPAEVVRWLVDVVSMDPVRAQARVAATATPSSAAFGYGGGAALVASWCGAEGDGRAIARFGELLGAPATPSALRAEVGSAGVG